MAKSRLIFSVWTSACMIGLLPAGLQAQEVQVAVEGGAYAKAPILLRVTMPRDGRLASVLVRKGLPDSEPIVRSTTSIPSSWRDWQFVLDEGDVTTITCVAVADYAMGQGGFFFADGGTYYLEWGVALKGDEDPLVVVQQLEVGEKRSDDQAFLLQIGSTETLRTLYGGDFFERQTPAVRGRLLASDGADLRTAKVVRELLDATRERVPWEVRGSMKSPDAWGDTMWSLAQEFPESSYAPYAASYAGCCYLTPVFEAYRAEKSARGIPDKRMTRGQFELLSSAARGVTQFDKADAALAFAASHGDAYLKPRALYYRTFVEMMKGDADALEATLDAVEVAAPGETTLSTWIAEQRKGLVKLRGMPSESDGNEGP